MNGVEGGGGEESTKMEMEGGVEKLVFMWGYLPRALPQRSPLLSPVLVRLPPSIGAVSSWKDVCGGGCGFAMAISECLSLKRELKMVKSVGRFQFSKAANQKGAMLCWVRKIHQEKKLDVLVDKDLGSNYDRIELEEMVQVALLCTQYLPGHIPKMSEVVRMLEGDGLAERWEASQRVFEATNCKTQQLSSSE